MSEKFKDEFVPSIRDWCEENSDRVSKCYASMHQGYPSIFVIGSAEPNGRDELGERLADLGQHLKRRGWQCNLVQIPRKDYAHYDAFLAAEEAVVVFEEKQ
jgi:hypothetical protein